MYAKYSTDERYACGLRIRCGDFCMHETDVLTLRTSSFTKFIIKRIVSTKIVDGTTLYFYCISNSNLQFKSCRFCIDDRKLKVWATHSFAINSIQNTSKTNFTLEKMKHRLVKMQLKQHILEPIIDSRLQPYVKVLQQSKIEHTRTYH